MELIKQLFENWITSPGTIIVTVLSVVGLILGPKGVRKRRVFAASEVGFYGVERLKAQYREEGRDTALLDKISEGFKIANEYLTKNNWGSLSETELAVVRLRFEAMHGAKKTTEQIATIASPTVVHEAIVPSPTPARPI
jgi:hypothetical protein